MRFFCILLLFLLAASCSGKTEAEAQTVPDAGAPAGAAVPGKNRERAAGIAASLDDRRLAAQLVISGIEGRGRPAPGMRLLLNECPAGGIMLFRYNLDTDSEEIKSLVGECAALIGQAGPGQPIPPFVAVDHEGGSVNRFPPGVAALPAAGTYGELARSSGREEALGLVERDSRRAGTEIRSLGINVNFAPVAEYLRDGNRAFLDDRSYGPDSLFAGEAAAAFVRGMEKAGVLCVVKHFPGSAGADPHRYPSVITGGSEFLDELAAPFAALIRDGQARAIMVSHTLVPARDAGNIASLSRAVMEDWLRAGLGFRGIIVSDDFSMAAAGSGAVNPAVRSLAAGADMVLVWPSDIRRTHRAILSALDDGSLSRERLREAAERIIFEKIRMGIIDGNL
ncbi:MAG: glycoside hydrolase family 3 protein [Treponema sp.]|nr:glycoside hydrolase family 3 protein [Treponema sp.]